MDKGFKIHIIFLLWLALACWVPSLIFDVEKISLCAMIAASIGCAVWVITNEASDSKGFFRKELPFTCLHFWIFVAYAVVGIFIIGFGDIPYKELPSFGKSIVFYIALTIIVGITEAFIKNRKEKRK